MTDLTPEQRALLEDDAGVVGNLTEIMALAKRQLELEGEVDILEQQLKEKKKVLLNISDRELPAAMAGVSRVQLDDGREVSVKEELTASVPKKRKHEIVEKLREWGAGDMIANTLTVQIDKGADEKAQDLYRVAADMGFVPKRDETVNTGSLKAYLKKRLEDGEDTDLQFFGAHIIKRAKIK